MTDSSGAIVVSAGDTEGLRDALRQRVGVQDGLSGMDKKILKLAAKRLSMEEIREELGVSVPPEMIGQRVREILRSRDWLALVETRALLLDDMLSLKVHLQEIVENEGGTVEVEGDDGETILKVIGDPRWSANLIRLFKEIGKVISDGMPSIDQDKITIRSAHAKLMGEAIELLFKLFLRELVKDEPSLDEMKLRELLGDLLPIAMSQIDDRVAE